MRARRRDVHVGGREHVVDPGVRRRWRVGESVARSRRASRRRRTAARAARSSGAPGGALRSPSRITGVLHRRQQLGDPLGLRAPLDRAVVLQVGVGDAHADAVDVDRGLEQPALLAVLRPRQQRVAAVDDRVRGQDRGAVLAPRPIGRGRVEVEVRAVDDAACRAGRRATAPGRRTRCARPSAGRPPAGRRRPRRCARSPRRRARGRGDRRCRRRGGCCTRPR